MGVYRYEHTEPLFDGRVAIDGVDATLETSPLISDVFHKIATGQLDIAECGLTYFLRSFDLDDSPFLALPIFPNRSFRHSALFVNVDSGIERPEDLAGKTIGEFPLWPKAPLDGSMARRLDDSTTKIRRLFGDYESVSATTTDALASSR